MKNLLVILAFISAGFAACKQEPYKITPPAPSGSYFPETPGSTWRYRDSVYGEPTDTVPIYGVHIDTLSFTINGKTTDYNSAVCYNAPMVSKLHGPGMAYFFANKHVYALLQSNAPLGFTNLQIFIDTASVGHHWTSMPTENTLLNGNPAQAVSTIIEKNITRVVGGVQFTNVVHTSVDFETNTNGAWFSNIAHYDFYLAQGVGLIEKDAYFYGYLNETQTIIDYNVKPETGK
jgi:hypothetical protein